MTVFDQVAADYDSYRPEYPDTLYDAIEAYAGTLRGRRVLDLGAGTGIATRALLGRGADVVATDLGADMLAVLHERSPDVPVVRSPGEALPFAGATIDVVTCATAWHWMDLARAAAEVRRVLRPGGVLALWWGFGASVSEGGDNAAARERAVFDRWQVWQHDPGTPGPAVDPRVALREHGFKQIVVRDRSAERVLTPAEHISHLRTHSLVLDLGDRQQEFLADLAEALSGCESVTERVTCHLVLARNP